MLGFPLRNYIYIFFIKQNTTSNIAFYINLWHMSKYETGFLHVIRYDTPCGKEFTLSRMAIVLTKITMQKLE